MRVYDFKCQLCSEIFEAFIKEGSYENVQCTACLVGNATRYGVSAPTFKLEGTSGDFPTAADKWVTDRKNRQEAERKQNS